MRTAIAVTLTAALLGFGAGWLAHSEPIPVVRYIERPAEVDQVTHSKRPFPEKPKPPLEAPVASVATPIAQPEGISGALPAVPPMALPPISGGPIGPLSPELTPATPDLPVADLAADEARVRRVVLALGGRVVSSADAKDTLGKVGRNIAVESDPVAMEKIASALQTALKNRIVLSKGGLVENSSPEIRKAEDALATLRGKRDKARIDFLPQAPILIDLEETTRIAERDLARRKRASSRQRLNILIRPAAGI